MEVEFNLDLNGTDDKLQTPAPPSARKIRARRQVRKQESSSDEENSPTSPIPAIPSTARKRSERASKTAALTKMTSTRASTIDEDDVIAEGESEVTADESSDESSQLSE